VNDGTDLRGLRRPANLFQVLVLAGLTGRRALAIRVGASLLLGFPFLFVPMPAQGRGAGVTLLVLFAGLFGAVVGNARLRSDGLWEKVRLLPLRRDLVALDVVVAGTVLDLIQTGPLLALVLILHGRWTGPAGLLAAAGFLCATLIALNGLGLLVASWVRSNAEAHLFGALAVAAVALLSGLFPVPGRIAGAVAWTGALLPPRHLLDALLAGMGAVEGRSSGLAGAVLLGATAAAVWARAANRPPARSQH